MMDPRFGQCFTIRSHCGFGSLQISLRVDHIEAKSGSELFHNRHSLKAKVARTVVVQIERQTGIKIAIRDIRAILQRLWSLSLEIKTEINATLGIRVPKLSILSREAFNSFSPCLNLLEVYSLGFTPAEIEVEAHKHR